MPFTRDTRVISRNTVLDRGPGSHGVKGIFGGRSPPFAAMPPIAKLLAPLLITIFHCCIQRQTVKVAGIKSTILPQICSLRNLSAKLYKLYNIYSNISKNNIDFVLGDRFIFAPRCTLCKIQYCYRMLSVCLFVPL